MSKYRKWSIVAIVMMLGLALPLPSGYVAAMPPSPPDTELEADDSAGVDPGIVKTERNPQRGPAVDTANVVATTPSTSGDITALMSRGSERVMSTVFKWYDSRRDAVVRVLNWEPGCHEVDIVTKSGEWANFVPQSHWPGVLV